MIGKVLIFPATKNTLPMNSEFSTKNFYVKENFRCAKNSDKFWKNFIYTKIT
jgi:hypothetical protein